MSWRRRAASTLVALSLVATATGRAQGFRPQFGFGTGLTVPVGDYHAAPSGQGFTGAWQGMIFAAFARPESRLGFRVDATYGTNGANDRLKAELQTRLGPATDEQVKLLGLNLDLMYGSRSAARVKPYLLGGLGIYHVTISVTSADSTTDDSGTKIAWNLGAGLSYGVGGVIAFLETRYVNLAAVSGFPRTTFLPITAGIRLRGR
ncbi:MAG TPA: outer membrane beta-barrel protein [Gemmatimonadales bacterium]|nr:outer membrane beta-barrel protein [Gemmatimonadales bacterium]